MNKKLMALVSIVLVLVMALAACTQPTVTPDPTPGGSDPVDPTPEVPEETPEPEMVPAVGGQLIYGATTEISGDWGRAMWKNNATDATIRELIDDYATIVSDPGGQYIVNPTITKDLQMEEHEDGTKTFTVTIHDDLVYNNGDPITAKDYVVSAVFSCSQVALDLGAQVTGDLSFVGGAEYKSGEATFVSGIRLLDEYTFSFTILAEKLPYFYDLTYASSYPMHPQFWFGDGIDVADDGEGCYFTGEFTAEAVGDAVTAARFESSNRVSAGPYNLVEFDQSALQATLEINENYKGNFEGQKPYVQKIIFTKAEDATWTDAIRTGAFEFYDTITDGSAINDALDIIAEGGFDYVQFTRAGYGKLMFQCDFGPTQFVEVRHAIAKLLDRNDFADTFCQGWGSVVHGPYGLGLWQYQDSEEWLYDNLNTYTYSYDDAVALLEGGGWTLDADGNAFAGSGVRHKEVTAEEAGEYAHNIVLADGRILMPLIIEWSSSEGNAVSDLLSVKLAQNPDVASAGIQINQNIMTFSELLLYMYRDDSEGEQYGVPTYGMYNLATNFTPTYDQSYYWTMDPDLVAAGWNQNFLFDEKMDQVTMDMVYGIESTDTEGYLALWQQYILRFNELLPEIPLYSNIYVTMIPEKLKGYTQDSFWDFQQAIVYAWIDEVPAA